MSENIERLFQVVEQNAISSTELKARMEALEERIESLEKTLEDRISTLESDMGTMNAHLDNIARETAIANDFNRKREEREEANRRAQEKERLELLKQNETIRKDKLEIFRNMGRGLWELLKFPLSTLVTGIVAWFLYQYFNVDVETVPKDTIEISIEEASK